MPCHPRPPRFPAGAAPWCPTATMRPPLRAPALSASAVLRAHRAPLGMHPVPGGVVRLHRQERARADMQRDAVQRDAALASSAASSAGGEMQARRRAPPPNLRPARTASGSRRDPARPAGGGRRCKAAAACRRARRSPDRARAPWNANESVTSPPSPFASTWHRAGRGNRLSLLRRTAACRRALTFFAALDEGIPAANHRAA